MNEKSWVNLRSHFARIPRRAPTLLAGLLLAAVVFATPTRAATLEIQLSGVDFVYDGNDIFDGGVQNTVRAGDPADGDALVSMNFLVDNVLVGTLSSDIWIDLYMADIGPVDAGGEVVVSGGNGGSFGVDLLTVDGVPGWGLALDIDTVQFFYTGNEIAISVAGLATDIFDQDLPFDLEFDETQPVTFVLSSANLIVETDDDVVTSIVASGTGNAKGVLIPEPSSMVLLAIGCVVAGWVGTRSRRRIA